MDFKFKLYALLLFFVEFSTISLIIMLLFVNLRLKRVHNKMMKKSLDFAILCLLCCILFSLTLYLEQGLFQGSIFLIMCVFLSFLNAVTEMLNIFFSSYLTVLEARPTNPAKKLIKNIALMLQLVFILMGITLMVISRNQQLFNLILVIIVLLLLI